MAKNNFQNLNYLCDDVNVTNYVTNLEKKSKKL